MSSQPSMASDNVRVYSKAVLTAERLCQNYELEGLLHSCIVAVVRT